LPAPAACSALTVVGSYGYKWISAPITTVRHGHKVPRATIELSATCFIIIAENLHPTAPRASLFCINHATIGRLIISLYRKSQETFSSLSLSSQSTVRSAF
jgi:hypothetical protein